MKQTRIPTHDKKERRQLAILIRYMIDYHGWTWGYAAKLLDLRSRADLGAIRDLKV